MSPLVLAFLNIRAKPLRNLLLTLIVALAAATALTLLVIADSIREGLRTGSDERGTDLTVSQRDAPDVLSGAVPAQLEQILTAIPGVASVSGELAMFAPLDGGKQSLVFGWTSNSAFWRSMPLASGRLPQPDDVRPAILGAGVGEALQKKAGDYIDIFGEAFRVIGIAGYKSALNRSVIVLRLPDLHTPRFIARRLGYSWRYPDISLEVQLTSRPVDLVAEGIDVAIRAWRPHLRCGSAA